MKTPEKVILATIFGLSIYLVAISGGSICISGEQVIAAPLVEPTLFLIAPAGLQKPEGTIEVQVAITDTFGLAALELDLLHPSTWM